MAYQQGSIYLHNDTWYLKYRITELADGTPVRVHKTQPLCKRDDEHPGYEKKDKKTGKSKIVPSAAVKLVRDKFMQKINADAKQWNSAIQDMLITNFWTNHYLPYCEKEWKGKGMKPSTLNGYKKIWAQHLENHFAKRTLQTYTSDDAEAFLSNLKTKQNKNTLKHIRGLASAMFSEAMERKLRDKKDLNPWKVKIPKDAKDPQNTLHYTLEQAENMISALVDHVDCQLILALACFQGLRPGEIAGLKFEDFDSGWIHIRRAVAMGKVGTPKTLESVASIPLIDRVSFFFELWRKKCGDRKEGWVFENRDGNPLDLHNVINRVIIPHVNGTTKCVPCDLIPKPSGVTWAGLYAGRRGACTVAIEATGGNYAVAQALLRHKSMTTTLNIYKKQITPEAFKAGMKLLQAAVVANENGKNENGKEEA